MITTNDTGAPGVGATPTMMHALIVAIKPRSGSVFMTVCSPQCREFGELSRATPPDQRR
jgi:hypothetical protein